MLSKCFFPVSAARNKFISVVKRAKFRVAVLAGKAKFWVTFNIYCHKTQKNTRRHQTTQTLNIITCYSLPASIKLIRKHRQAPSRVYILDRQNPTRRKRSRVYIRLPEISKETLNNPSLQRLKKTIIKGWPNNKANVAKDIQQYLSIRDKHSMQDEIMFKGQRCIIPKSLRKTVK